MLEATQKGDLDVTEGLEWLLGCLDRAIAGAEETLSSVLRKARFWEANKNQLLNERQRRVIDRLLDGFEGKLTSSKWAALTESSPDTALRDCGMRIFRGNSQAFHRIWSVHTRDIPASKVNRLLRGNAPLR
ncbi:MAG: hypothetical protein MUD16_07245 [Desulfobacterales bacterium]|nr:hypothetical protein [Desulfobacterales bacterium]